MEPGLRDREYLHHRLMGDNPLRELQWSPVLETGNTRTLDRWLAVELLAAMEPGLRDREYPATWPTTAHSAEAAMEPGLRDREYQRSRAQLAGSAVRCNGARS